LRQHIEPAQLDQAIDMLAKADTIYLVGLRRSFPISSYMAYAFGKLGVKSRLVDAVGGLAQEDASFATTKDCVLAISFTPYASETVALAQSAAARKVPIVAITDSPFSPLASIATTWFEIQEANFEGFRSMAATLTLAMTLTVAVADRRSARKAK
jgi:DNA-binding MurR/RpiR family transcriptional regulator